MPQVYSPPSISKASIMSLVQKAIDDKLAQYKNILDGVALEELTNFDVPLLSAQTTDEKVDGVLLGYKDGKLVEEKDLNGGEF
jgi:hypothetical protein